VHSDTEVAIVDAVKALRRDAQQAARNDSAGYNAIVSATDSLLRSRSPVREQGESGEGVDELLQDAAKVLATAARFSPGQSRRLVGEMFRTAQANLTGLQLDRWNDVIRSRSERAREFPDLDALISIMGDASALFPHGLVPIELRCVAPTGQ
jgi:hypothetical protein